MKLRDLQAAASVCLILMSSGFQQGFAQQAAAPAASISLTNVLPGDPVLPQAPAPKFTEPLFLRDTGTDYTKPKSHLFNPIAPYTPTFVPLPRLTNSTQLDGLMRDGKMYLSLSDAIALALENNFDIAIARINWISQTRTCCGRGRDLRFAASRPDW